MSPCDELRYARLLEGLEVTILPYSEAISADPTGRLDSSFFEKRFIEIRKRAAAWDRLDIHAKSVVCGPFGSNLLNENYVERGVPMIRPFNLRDCRSDQGDIALLKASFVDDEELKTFGRNTVMFARVGEVGAGVNLYDRATISPNIIAAELLKTVNPYFVGVFANTKFGRLQLEAGMKVVAQPTISTDSIRALRIPPLNQDFQRKIAEMFMKAVDLEDRGVKLLTDAEKFLLHALGLKEWKIPDPLTYLRSSREAFAAGRLDAEHFKPKYDELLEYLEKTGEAKALGSMLAINERGNQPEYAEKGLPVVNSKHVFGGEIRLDAENRVAAEDAAKILIEPNDVLMNGTGVGTIGRSAPYLHSGKAIPDNHVTILRPKPNVIDPIYLSVFINSVAGQMQVEQRLHGSSGQIELYPSDIAEFVIWVAPEEIQKKVRQAIENGFTSKQRAIHLLDTAKHAVEIAVEQNERAALDYLRGI
ncbi:restriction endonuclease subunit S [Oxalicibacterium solurbis]|uniref:Restriction endonuclease subunit S n=1 Tax=Oxalicibacterium solurbis TaxID=69280 RepID=A0A8J3F735_9BURK|nr:restriction endonuclease subunit S [Oxalicibacterium solurbis]GGI55156.1 hypothetical protein GCM10011430_23300 [Oxalicibacterium solurbis]